MKKYNNIQLLSFLFNEKKEEKTLSNTPNWILKAILLQTGYNINKGIISIYTLVEYQILSDGRWQ